MIKRLGFLAFTGLLLFAMLTLWGCKPKVEPTPETPPETTVTPPPPPPKDTTPPPPPPKPMLKVEQFKTVYFDFDKYNLRPDAKSDAEFDYNLLNQYPDAIVEIQGNCDERGTVEYNLSLGQKRADAVKDYLVSLGVSPDRLKTISYGKERPVDPGHNEAAWAKNRRCEFRIISQ
jgi:peptidoglycan-associated lipoprotein